jgi:branched-chain amino acid transport system ATP-binding protein
MTGPSSAPLLAVSGLCSGYGPVQVLYGIDIEVRRGEVVALLGPNGAGKTTLLRTIAGQIRPTSGTITVDGRPVGGLSPERVVGTGLVLVDEGRAVFPTLTVEENLMMGAHRRRLPARALAAECERAYDLFPRLAERRTQLAGKLSGGEQQMLVIGRALLSEPRVVLIDELSLGLAPKIVLTLLETIQSFNAERGTACLLVEQAATAALKIATSAYLLQRGNVVYSGPAARLRDDVDVLHSAYLGQGTARRETATRR